MTHRGSSDREAAVSEVQTEHYVISTSPMKHNQGGAIPKEKQNKARDFPCLVLLRLMLAPPPLVTHRGLEPLFSP